MGGYYAGLKDGFRELGLPCTWITFGPHPFGYQPDNRDHPLLWKLHGFARRGRMAVSRKDLIGKAYWICLQQASCLLFFAWALLRHQAFIFEASSTFFNFRELPLLKLLGKKVVYVFHGSDARPPYLSGHFLKMDAKDLARWARQHKRAIRRIEAYADIVVVSPMAAHFHERSFVPFERIGIPFRQQRRPLEQQRSSGDGKIRILHAPSNPQMKRSSLVRQMVERLAKKGYPVELVEKSRVPNEVILEEIAQCDFVILGAYSDTAMGHLAAEAASFSKPTVVGGYTGEEIQRVFPPEAIPPTCYCHPDNMEEMTEKLIVDKEYRERMGARAKRFVETYYAPREVAGRFLRLLTASAPAEWLFDPKEVQYLFGYGLAESEVKAMVRRVLSAGGEEALQLPDKPRLRKLFVDFAHAA